MIHDNCKKVSAASAGVEWTVDGDDYVVVNLFRVLSGSLYATLASPTTISSKNCWNNVKTTDLVKILVIDLFAHGHPKPEVSLSLVSKVSAAAEQFKLSHATKSQKLLELDELITAQRASIENEKVTNEKATANKKKRKAGADQKRTSLRIKLEIQEAKRKTALELSRLRKMVKTKDQEIQAHKAAALEIGSSFRSKKNHFNATTRAQEESR